MTAAAVLLAAAVMLHFGLPHHSSATPSAVSAGAPAIESEYRKAQGPELAAAHAGTESQHHEAADDALAMPPRAVHLVEPPSLAEDATANETLASLVIVSGMPHPRAARDVWNPGGGLAPEPATLQTFRC
ncbi:hypothetical protein ACQEVY_11855 [Streptomyces sp. CA-288835]|uniref:hypothetical protein n=1 Tax=Streptomyces sp. CA-288835 TaxID=3240069 RepID=UPI003D8C6D01